MNTNYTKGNSKFFEYTTCMKVLAALKTGWKAYVCEPRHHLESGIVHQKSIHLLPLSMIHRQIFPSKQFEIQQGYTILYKNWISPIISDVPSVQS